MPNPQIEGLPEGAIVKPIEGLPEGAIVRPRSQAPAPAPDQGPNYWERLTNPVGSGAHEQGLFGGALQVGGQAIKTMAQPFIHPVDTAKSLWHTYTDPLPNADLLHPEGAKGDLKTLSPPTADFVTSLKKDPALTLENAAGSGLGMFEGGRIAGGAGEAVKPIGTGLKAGASHLDNAIIGSGPHAERFGANPGAALSQNRIIGTTPASLSGKIGDLIPATAAEHRSVLANAPAGARINTGPLVNLPFLDTIGKASDPVTGAGGLQPIRSALRTQRELNHVIDPDTGNLTPSMRNPLRTPVEANDLKSNLYGRIDYDNPSKTALANNSLKGAAYNLKEAVRSAVPESAETGQRLYNLEAAKDVLEPRVRAQRSAISGPAWKQRALMGLGTGGAAAMDATGSGLISPRLSAILKGSMPALSAIPQRNQEDAVPGKKRPKP